MPDPIGRAAAKKVLEKAMAVRRHALARHVLAQLGEIGAVPDLVRLAQLEVVEMPRGEAVGDVQQQQLGAGETDEAFNVLQDGTVGGGVLDGNKDLTCDTLHEP